MSQLMPMKDPPSWPAERALKVISGRWKAVLLHLLFDGPKRLSQLSRIHPEISQKALIQQLREMEQHLLVRREVFHVVPPRVEYTATPLGRSLEPALLALCAWGRQHATLLDELDRLRGCSRPELLGGPTARGSEPL